MAAPFTQAFIQAKIEFYADMSEKAAKQQEYIVDQGGASEFAIKRGKLEEIEESLDKWIGRMEKYYPGAYTVVPQIHFNEIGYLNG